MGVVLLSILLIGFFAWIFSGNQSKNKKHSQHSTPTNHKSFNNQVGDIPLATRLKKPPFIDACNIDISKNGIARKSLITHDTRDFIVFDFETANLKRHSACALGIAIVNDLKIVESRHYFISPQHNEYFLQRFVSLHQICWEHVHDKQFFFELWPEIEPLFCGNLIVAYNAPFDVDVLTKTLNFYNIALPEIRFNCALDNAKTYIEGLPNYKLSSVCDHLKIDLNHHQAESDAIAAASITIHIINLLQEETLKEQEKNLNRENRQKRIDKIREMKDNGTYQAVENIKKCIRHNRKKMIENPEKLLYAELYAKYKQQYFETVGYEYKELTIKEQKPML